MRGPAARYNSGMSLRDIRRHVGQLSIAGFAGYSIPPDLRALAREFDLGGIILFARNVDAPDQVADISREAQTLAQELPLWVSVDQEGGRVARLKAPFTVWPPMLTLGRSGDTQLAIRFARALAAELKAVGISLDYTPVLDVLTNAKNPVIGDRALAERAEDVAALGRAIITTLQGEGIAACGKHFPGHGDTAVDSHFELPLIEHPPDRLEAVELVPFRAAIDAGVASIMTAHILIPALDAERPATLSPQIVDGMLKRQLGYGGLVLSDDLEMKAISSRYGIPEATVEAIAAGCDAVLMCGASQETQAAALEAVIRAVEQGTLPEKRVEDALARHRRVKERFLAPRAHAAAQRRRAARRARPRRASGRRRRDGQVRVTACRKPRGRCGRATGSPSSLPPARFSATSSTPASRSCRRSDSSRCSRNPCSRERLRRRVGRTCALRPCGARGTIPSIAALDRRSRRLRQRADAAAARCAAVSAGRPRRSSATATTRRSWRG